MIEFAAPWLFLLLPVPLLVFFLMPPYKERQESLRVPYFARLVMLTGEQPDHGAAVLGRKLSQRILLPVAWLLLVLAAAKPEWVGEPITVTRSARDLMVVVDLSGSMAVNDLQGPENQSQSRLDSVKRVLAEFVRLRGHDRIGLILFGDAAYLQSPFTGDHDAWLKLLAETEIGMAGQSTAFGDAIGLAIKLFRASDAENRVLIALTDGNDTGSRVPPVDAAKVASVHDIKIYTVAVGDPETVGEETLDVETLARIAELTGGAYFQAFSRQQLEAAYAAINELEPHEFETLSYRPRRGLYHYPLGVMLSIYLVFHLSMIGLAGSRRMRAEGIPKHG